MKSIHKIIVKNMVCPRCIEAVEEILADLNLQYTDIDLGNVYFKEELSKTDYEHFNEKLKERGFEIIISLEEKIVNHVKSLIVEQIHYNDNQNSINNFSEYLEDKMEMKYSKISKIFSSEENRTIEKYIILQKIEKVKELLSYNELTLSEISYKLDYSSPQHLSKQFKKVTGQTPSQYKNNKGRSFLNDI